MTGAIIALGSLAIAVSVIRILMYGREKDLKLKSQLFKFHELRDRLRLAQISSRTLPERTVSHRKD